MADVEDLLRDNEHIKELLKIFSVLDEKDKVNDLSALIHYVDNMEMQFNKVLKELREVKIQLTEVQKNPVKDALIDMVKKVENKILETKDKLKSIKTKIIEGAAQTLENVRYVGLVGLNKITSFLGVRKALETMRDNLKQAEGMMENTIVKLGNVGQELRGAGQYIKNAGRILVGKERQEIGKVEQGHIASVILSPMRNTHNILSGMEKTVASAIDRLDHLEQVSERKQSNLQGTGEMDKISCLSQNHIEYLANIEKDFAECQIFLKHYEDINGKPNNVLKTLITAIYERIINLSNLTNNELAAMSKVEKPITSVYGSLVVNTEDNQFSNDNIDIAIRDIAKAQTGLLYNKYCSEELENDMEQ